MNTRWNNTKINNTVSSIPYGVHNKGSSHTCKDLIEYLRDDTYMIR
jgi:hypothetical protein